MYKLDDEQIQVANTISMGVNVSRLSRIDLLRMYKDLGIRVPPGSDISMAFSLGGTLGRVMPDDQFSESVRSGPVRLKAVVMRDTDQESLEKRRKGAKEYKAKVAAAAKEKKVKAKATAEKAAEKKATAKSKAVKTRERVVAARVKKSVAVQAQVVKPKKSK